jgi:hypothetical protein
MPSYEPVNFDQPDNQLSKYAETERKKLAVKNDYKENDLYSSTHPDAMADGDELGKGTGIFLDSNNQKAGSGPDIIERKKELVINKYSDSKPYKI